MSRRNWHILRSGIDGARGVTVARHLPAQFDVAGQGMLPAGNPVAFAQQIRQDLWRLLQRERGFSPVIELTPCDQGWRVRAGGRLAARPAPGLSERITALLADPARRNRWIAQARKRQISTVSDVLPNTAFDNGGMGGQ